MDAGGVGGRAGRLTWSSPSSRGLWGVLQLGRCGTVMVRLERGGRSLLAGAGGSGLDPMLGEAVGQRSEGNARARLAASGKGCGLSMGEDPGAETGLALLKVTPLLVQLGGREPCTHSGWCSLG